MNKNENIEYTNDKFLKEFWTNSQDFGKQLGCKISNKPSRCWHKFCPFNIANMLDEYINTFITSKDYLAYEVNNTCEKQRKVQAMKAISAVHKATMDARSIFLGLAVGVISFGITLIISSAEIYNNCGDAFAYFVWLIYSFLSVIALIYPLYQNKSSIISSAINDAIEQSEKICQNDNINEMKTHTKKHKKIHKK